MIVSLEAIFLSTFVLISQNRTDAKCQIIADPHGRPSRKRNGRTKSCSSSRIKILDLTEAILAVTVARSALVADAPRSLGENTCGSARNETTLHRGRRGD
jgi:uncharacterized membrane protein